MCYIYLSFKIEQFFANGTIKKEKNRLFFSLLSSFDLFCFENEFMETWIYMDIHIHIHIQLSQVLRIVSSNISFD